MENHGYGDVVGSGSAPYLSSLARRCGIATNYDSVAHPSLPNYIAATSGQSGSALDRFLTDCSPSPDCSTSARSIFAQAPSWRAYEQSMPGPCHRRDSGEYAVRHNPPPYYRSLRGCARFDVPIDRFHRDLVDGSLPAFAFVTPNVCNDTHDCPIETGDRWLSGIIPELIGSSAYRAGHTVVFITYDEGEGGGECHASGGGSSCHVPTVVVSPSTPAGKTSAEPFTHYSLLRTAEDLLGLPHLGAAAGAPSMAPAFGLSRSR